jgi:hypothetical protein
MVINRAAATGERRQLRAREDHGSQIVARTGDAAAQVTVPVSCPDHAERMPVLQATHRQMACHVTNTPRNARKIVLFFVILVG